ncbi:hypothetical protein M413DRAFT_443694 [Hebeloma cylindrosporum]|uniref:Uncharacterized protein n=1 Tax=Hebeloma cylindrosporum TaxID=76867 RepID=A0A0C2Y1S8_HEBCY|nr:hypothetical protein M413DRAFT_443694 [Hebeloma cylindrosporum h7]
MHLSVAPRQAGISRLSQELIDEIIDYFKPLQDDHGWEYHCAVHLRSIALISRVFRPRSQKHLFTHIGVDMSGTPVAEATLGRLNIVFYRNHRLASHVRTFILRTGKKGELCRRSFVYPHFIACLAHILLSRRTYLSAQPLQIQLTRPGFRRDSPIASLSHLSIDSKTHFIPLVVTSRLTTLEIGAVHDVPITLFDACSNLRRLDVLGVRLAPFEESKRIPLEKRPLIRELLVGDSEDFICRTGLRFDNLQKLTFQGTLEFEDLVTMRHIFAGVDSNLSSLEELNFFLTERCDYTLVSINTHLYPEIGIDFARMPNLREFVFEAPCAEDTFRPDETAMGRDMITGLSDMFATFPADHKLKRVYIFFDFSMMADDFDDDDDNDDDNDATNDNKDNNDATNDDDDNNNNENHDDNVHNDEIDDHGPGPVEAHLKTGNWAAFDATILRITSSLKQPLEFEITIEYHIEWEQETMFASVEKARLKDEGTLKVWAAKYLPRTSGSPNVVMKVFTIYDDSENHPTSHLRNNIL